MASVRPPCPKNRASRAIPCRAGPGDSPPAVLCLRSLRSPHWKSFLKLSRMTGFFFNTLKTLGAVLLSLPTSPVAPACVLTAQSSFPSSAPAAAGHPGVADRLSSLRPCLPGSVFFVSVFGVSEPRVWGSWCHHIWKMDHCCPRSPPRTVPGELGPGHSCSASADCLSLRGAGLPLLGMAGHLSLNG